MATLRLMQSVQCFLPILRVSGHPFLGSFLERIGVGYRSPKKKLPMSTLCDFYAKMSQHGYPLAEGGKKLQKKMSLLIGLPSGFPGEPEATNMDPMVQK